MLSISNSTSSNITGFHSDDIQHLEREFIASVSPAVNDNNFIDKNLYDVHEVKMGLRNKNGTGVLVGLTNIADVQGYDIDENGNKLSKPGKLYYRGIDIEDIVNAVIEEQRFGYEEVSYLLMFGELPNHEQLQRYTKLLGGLRRLPPLFTRDVIMANPSPSIMNQIAISVLSMYPYDERPDDTSIQNVIRQSINLIASFSTIAAYSYQAKKSHFDNLSLHLHYPMETLSTAENILRLIRPLGEYTTLEARLLDISLILHADHGGGNNSSFTTHLVSSTGTDTYSAIAAAVGSLKGPRHGGANHAVINMIHDLKENVYDITNFKKVEEYLQRVIKGEANDGSGLIYGLGHAIYTITDPRAQLLKKMARMLAEKNNLMDDFMLYDFIETKGSEIFSEATGLDVVLPANVDLYSGFVYDALNIPRDLATPIFACARISGWCAHRIEELGGNHKIMRPAYQCVQDQRPYKKMDER